MTLAPWMAPYVDGVWQVQASTTQSHLVLPDNCMDLVHRQGAWFVVGPMSKAYQVSTSSNADHFGVRFMPGMLPLLTGWHAEELLDQKRALSEQALGKILLCARTHLTEAESDGRFALVQGLWQCQGETVSDVAKELGWSQRHLGRLAKRLLGYSTKRWLRVRRLQRMMPQLGKTNLAELALESGFSDQAHMTRESVVLTGRTPTQLASQLGAQASGIMTTQGSKAQ